MQQQTMPFPMAESRFLYIQTMGCQMNEYDSLRVRRMLAARGYRPTANIEAADVVFLNTCSVREKAEQKVYSFLGRLRTIKAERPGMKIVVAGCLAQQLGKKLLGRFPQLDLVLGTRAIGSLPELLDELEGSGRRVAHLPEEEDGEEDFNRLLFQAESGVAAPVTIMRGCDNFCAYCIVPYVRGRERSRSSEEIIREIEWLSEAGVREILLLGQNVNSYGRGLSEQITFAELLRRIRGETDVRRIRFTTSHPKDLTEALIRCFAEMPSLCKHLHLPFQAGSDRVLERMRRRYTVAQYLDKIERLREACPEIALTSDAMVGFPGETEADFRETLHLIERVRFDGLFSFRYSDRPYTDSAGFADKASEKIKARRLAELQALQAEITLEKNRAEVGRLREVLLEGPSKTGEGQIAGRTEQNRVVNMDGPESLTGCIVQVEITESFSHSLRGRLVLEPEV